MKGHPAFAKKYADKVEAARAMGNRYDPDHCGRFPWDTSVTLAQASLGRLLFWTHVCGGCVSSTFTLSTPPSPKAARGHSVEVRLWLWPERVAMVEREAKVRIRPAPVAHVNGDWPS